MKLDLFKYTGEKTTKKVDLSNDIFAISPNDHAIYLDVKQYLASNRSGTHKAKERSEIKGSRRKLRKQKGSGAARVGDIKNPIFRGGGRAFGPRPRDYHFKLNKKVKRLARKSALSYKAKEKNIIVLEDFKFKSPKTKDYLSFLEKLGLNDFKTILILSESNKNLYLSARNIKQSRVVLASELNTYDVMNANKLILMHSSVKAIEDNF